MERLAFLLSEPPSDGENSEPQAGVRVAPTGRGARGFMGDVPFPKAAAYGPR